MVTNVEIDIIEHLNQNNTSNLHQYDSFNNF